MINFEDLFRKTKGQPAVVDGVAYNMMLKLFAKSGEEIHLQIDKVIKAPRQGIRVDSDRPIVVNGKQGTAHSCWLCIAPSEIVIHCPQECCLIFRNIWDNGDGVEQSWHAGGAMTWTKVDGVMCVRCNSTLANDEMNDLVFRIG